MQSLIKPIKPILYQMSIYFKTKTLQLNCQVF